jgi:hypothetical protein
MICGTLFVFFLFFKKRHVLISKHFMHYLVFIFKRDFPRFTLIGILLFGY